MKDASFFAEVILPLSLKGTYTYSVPGAMQNEAVPGKRVMVQFGKKKHYAALIRRVHSDQPTAFEPKPILSVIDDHPLVGEQHLQFWDWIAAYYMCTPGEVMMAALPQGLKLQSESVFHVSTDHDLVEGLDQQEQSFLEYVGEEEIESIDEVRKSVFGEEGVRMVRRLLERGALVSGQEVKSGYAPKMVKCVGIDASIAAEASLVEAIESLKRAPAQAKALEEVARLSGRYIDQEDETDVTRKALAGEGVSSSAIQSLVKKGLLYTYEVQASRISEDGPRQLDLPVELTGSQEKALQKIRQLHAQTPVVLLHGITSSGKTEVYVHLIREQLEAGRQVLYLMPEIALTTQMIDRLKNVFGDQVGVYHSQYQDAERVEVFMNVAGRGMRESFGVILGVRSALFLPFRNLGLIIIDEEQEYTFKQSDPAPRYHARDAATILGLFSNAKLVLGSATPSFESMHNAKTGKYGMVELHERFGNVLLPEIIVADVRQAKKRKQMQSYFTPEMIAALDETLALDKQAIFFQNRRGYSNYLQCTSCNHIPRCRQCDVSLTYHKFQHEMVCHYCGFRTPVPKTCPDCGQQAYQMRGFGTEKLEDELGMLYPDLRISRLDLDNIRTRKGFERILNDFGQQKTQVLVGTQLVTKGLDFEHVHMVGIVDADSMMFFPDFRAFERSFQLMTQVSGRAGRRLTRGKVVIQTSDPGHPVIERVLKHDYEGLFREQMAERKLFRYPPFVRLIRLSLRHEVPSILDAGAVFLANELKEIFGNRILGPQQPVVARTHGKYIKQIMVKIEKESSFERAKQLIGELIDIFAENPVYKQIRLVVDVDPL